MIGWLLTLVIAGAIIGLIYGLGKGENDSAKEGVVAGAATGFGVFIIILEYLIPIIIILAIIKSCS